jgi:hypothetical protein
MQETTNGSNGKLALLLKRKAELDARIAQVSARDKAKDRKLATRRKIVIGACIMADVSRHPESGPVIEEMLRRAATPRDRELLRSGGWRV